MVWSLGTIKIESGTSRNPRMQIVSSVGAMIAELWPFYINKVKLNKNKNMKMLKRIWSPLRDDYMENDVSEYNNEYVSEYSSKYVSEYTSIHQWIHQWIHQCLKHQPQQQPQKNRNQQRGGRRPKAAPTLLVRRPEAAALIFLGLLLGLVF